MGTLTQTIGLVIVILIVGAALTMAAGSQTIRQRVVQPDGSVKTYEVTRNRFLNADVLLNYAKDTSFVAIMAVGMTAVIISAGIDLSVGSIYALAGVIGAMALHYFGPASPDTHAPILGTCAGIAITLAVAAGCGLVNGIAVVALKVHPFIITLGTMLIFRGLAFVTTGARSIGDFPAPMTSAMRTNLGLADTLQPVPLLIMLAVMVAGVVYLQKMVAGRHVYAVGGNLETARFSGLPISRILISVYLLAGLTAGIAAVVANGVYGSASSDRGAGYELKVIAAAVVGGASLVGGRGTAIGAVLGAMLIQLIDQGIITLGIDQNYNQIIIGLAIIIAVVLDRVSARIATRRLKIQTA